MNKATELTPQPYIEKLKACVRSEEANLSDTLFFAVRDSILTGELKPGHVFPNEQTLCASLGIGRSTLREAYSRLVSLNLITRSKAGTTVNGTMSRASILPLGQIAEQSNLDDLMSFRRILEEETAAAAAAKATPEDIAALNEIIAGMKENIDNLGVLTVHDTRFHMELTRIAGNGLISQVMSAIRKNFETAIYIAFEKDNTIMFRAIFYHERIVEAIREGDCEKARSIMREHIQNVINAILL